MGPPPPSPPSPPPLPPTPPPFPPFIKHLPKCYCVNFVNGLTSAYKGKIAACMKEEVHGSDPVPVAKCAYPTGPYIPTVDDGCPVDHLRCNIVYERPKFPMCDCKEYGVGASPSSTDDLCQKPDGTCLARNYAYDKKIGDWEYYGCPDATKRCTLPEAPEIIMKDKSSAGIAFGPKEK